MTSSGLNVRGRHFKRVIELDHPKWQEEQLKEALKTYQDALCFLTLQPKNKETNEAKAEIEDAIKSTAEILKEFEEPSGDEMEIDTDGSSFHRPKRKHNSGPKRHTENRQACSDVMEETDFALLAMKYPNFRKHVHATRDGICSLDFADPEATLELTKAILKESYGLEWDIPLGQLVPPVPCRTKYVSWIRDLLNLFNPFELPIIGLDVGCGANCIFPLIGASTYGWKFVGTDITDVAIHSAQNNVDRNRILRDRIQIVQTSGTDILTSVVQQYGSFHFSMCNPPFFNDMNEAGQNLKTGFGGTAAEMVYPGSLQGLVFERVGLGGEVAFVGKMIEESIELNDQVCWFSALLGKKSSFKTIRNYLHQLNVAALRTLTFQQGKMTRWAIAWSFLAKNTDHLPLRFPPLPPPSHTPLMLEANNKTVQDALNCIEQVLEAHLFGKVVKRDPSKIVIECNEHDPETKDSTLTVEVVQDSTDRFVLRIRGNPRRKELFMNIWDDVCIIWCH